MIIKLAPNANKIAKPANDVSCHSHLCSSDETSDVSAHSAINGGYSHITKEKKKITRTKTGCLCCRRRKKKCDELKPGCSGCVRNNLDCVYPTEEALKSNSQNASSRKSKKQTKSFDLFEASVVLAEMKSPEFVPSSPSQPALSSPDSANSSDSESPLSSPRLQPFSLNTPASNTHAKVPFLSINTINYKSGSLNNFESKTTRHISVKSLLN